MSQMNALVQSFSSMRHEMSQISGQWAYQPKTEPQDALDAYHGVHRLNKHTVKKSFTGAPKMTPENTQKLYSDFPNLYRGKDKSPEESPMSFGFQCSDGWFSLIWKLSSDIEKNAAREGIDPQSGKWPEAVQVKQKFGALRFYLDNSTEELARLISEAAEESGKICEICGNPGVLISDSRRYVRTLCSAHARGVKAP